MKRLTLSIESLKEIKHLIIHLPLSPVKFHRNLSLNRLVDVGETLNHRPTYTYLTDNLSELLFMPRIDTNDFVVTRPILDITVTISEVVVRRVNLRKQPLQDRPQLIWSINESRSSHSVLELCSKLLDVPSPLVITIT